MNILSGLFVIIIGLLGGIITISMFLGMFVVIGWKIYRKIRYGFTLYQ